MPKNANLLLLALLLMAGVASAQSDKPAPAGKDNSVYAELTKAPKKAMARRNPLATDPEALAAGGKLFAMHCAECHGEMAEGGKKAPSLLAPEVQQATPGTLFWLLTNGVVRRGMPVWSKLPEPQRWQLVSYIKSLTLASTPPDTEKTAPAGASTSHPQSRLERPTPQQVENRGVAEGAQLLATSAPAHASNSGAKIMGWVPLRDALIQIVRPGNAAR